MRTNWAINGLVEYTFKGTQYTEGETVKVTWYDGDTQAASRDHGPTGR